MDYLPLPPSYLNLQEKFEQACARLCSYHLKRRLMTTMWSKRISSQRSIVVRMTKSESLMTFKPFPIQIPALKTESQGLRSKMTRLMILHGDLSFNLGMAMGRVLPNPNPWVYP
ncbi:unnamed protein product [Linum trigynum]|uniref:Uncharacterized protein n=1 Tax=Linum trigynum TaxID=586398 RepID=A0AAV2DEZ8_9ROSI